MRNLRILLAIVCMIVLLLSMVACTQAPSAGDTVTDDPTTGDSTTGDPTTGDPTTGDPTTDDPTTDDPTTSDPVIQDPTEIVDITLTGAKTSFPFGKAFSTDGLVVTGVFSDGTQKTLSGNDYFVTSNNFDPMKVGTYQVSVGITDTNITKTYQVSVLPADRLKVLMIGNSYADDAINYAYEIARSVGIPAQNILIADIYIGSCSLATHWSNAQSNAAVYRFGLEKEGWFDGKTYQNWTMEQAIKYTDWDFITLQQNSGNSGIASSYADLQNLMDYVLRTATNPDVKLVWHHTWAYAQNTSNAGFSSYQRDQMAMYQAIGSCLKTEVLTKNFAAVIPNGTAIQNARTSFIGDNLTRDGYDHLSEDAGRYIAALGLVSTLTGADISTVTWKPSDSGFPFVMSSQMLAVCKESCANAIAAPDRVTDSQYPPENPFSVFEGKGTRNSPYLIQSADDLRMLSELTRGQSCADKNTYFKLTADIDLGTESWEPICSSAATGWVETANSFNGNFDGNGKTITFVGNYTGDTWAKGLFSAVGGHVHDLILKGKIETEKGRVGSLASMAMTGAKIENVTSYVNITASNNQIGGIIGYIAAPDVTITNCVNHGNITGRELVGGIVGGSWQNIAYTGCVNHGAVTATSTRAGGIAGEKFPAATLTNCLNHGKIQAGGTTAASDIGAAGAYAGNLIGYESK